MRKDQASTPQWTTFIKKQIFSLLILYNGIDGLGEPVA